MAIKIGTDTVSSFQRDRLSQASNYLALRQYAELARLLYSTVLDEDVLDGSETLHPEWINIYEAARSHISQTMPKRAFREIQTHIEPILNLSSEVHSINPENQTITFLLGAGASKPEPSGIPTVKELLPDMLLRARRLDRDDVNRLADFCDEKKIDNIEDLLTAAQLAEYCSQNPNVLSLVDFLLFGSTDLTTEFGLRRRPRVDYASVLFLQDTLQVLFGLLSSRMLPARPNDGHIAIANYAKNQPATSIVTTNYDCCVDLALNEVGQEFDYMADFAKDGKSEAQAPATKLVKLHGSLNWFYCETCQKVHLIDIATTVDNYLKEKAFYPVIAVCQECGGQRRGLLVPPLAMKFDVAPSLNSLLEEAVDAFDSAETVAVVGFSFSEADVYISRMLSKWISADQSRRMIIFDPDFKVSERVRKQFSMRIPNFDPSRILSVIGDCAVTLPKFLKGEYFQAQMANEAEVVMTQS